MAPPSIRGLEIPEQLGRVWLRSESLTHPYATELLVRGQSLGPKAEGEAEASLQFHLGKARPASYGQDGSHLSRE